MPRLYGESLAVPAHLLGCRIEVYVRILHLAASDGERSVEAVLGAVRAEGTLPLYESVRERVRGPRTAAGVPDVRIPPPDLACYDRLLGSYAQQSEVAP